MSGDERPFRPRPSKPRERSGPVQKPPRRFTSQVVQVLQTSGAARFAHGGAGARKGAAKGRGWVAARLLGDRAGPRTRRVIVKARLVVLAKAAGGSAGRHLAYIQRDGVTPQGHPGQAYDAASDRADGRAFVDRGAGDRHQFRFIVSAEDSAELGELKTFTRDLMGRMQADLGSKLDWIAVDHYDTDNPHTHIVLRGVDHAGEDLVIARDYIADGFRLRASLLATERLGPVTEREIRDRLVREVEAERWTGLDRQLSEQARRGGIDLQIDSLDPDARRHRNLLIGRLQTLERLGLAHTDETGGWRLKPDVEATLRGLGARGDIIRTLQTAFGAGSRGLNPAGAQGAHGEIVGAIVRKGLADALQDRAYLVVDGVDGRGHYVLLPPGADLEALPTGGVVSIKAVAPGPRPSDRAIAALAHAGVYRPTDHLKQAQTQRSTDPQAFVDAHIRRLEALRRAGLVERIDADHWRLPPDFLARTADHETQRHGGVEITLRSHLSLDRQVRALGATWLDQNLLEKTAPPPLGFGAEVGSALERRKAFLVRSGATRLENGRLPANLLESLRKRELDKITAEIVAETGLEPRPVSDNARVDGTYRRAIQLTSGRFAMLDDGVGFSLVPWRPALDQRLGQTVSANIRAGAVTWTFGRSRGPSI